MQVIKINLGQLQPKNRKKSVLHLTFCLFFKTRSWEEVKKIEHVQRDKAEKEYEEEPED